MRKLGYICVLAMVAASMQAAVVTKDLSVVKAEDLGNLLAGAGIQITNVKYTGATNAAGTFTGGVAAGFGMESGVILSSGDIKDVVGPNDETGASTNLGKPGDADLDALIAPRTTNDATILEFDFVAESPNFAIQYMFGSEEYKEWVGSAFNDVFGFFLDGQNIAFVAGSATELVSVNSINHVNNSSYYIDNPTGEGTFDTELDGFTTVLIAAATVTPGATHHIKLAIADATDSALDSVVVLAAGGITGAPQLTLIADPYENFNEWGGETTFKVRGYGFADEVKYTLSGSGLPEGSTVTFAPQVLEKGKNEESTVKVKIALNAMPRRYVLNIAGEPDSSVVSTARGSALISVECRPPVILAEDEPRSQIVAPGATATLDVHATGSGPFTYQWYRGPRGSTWFPIAGATTSTYTTPAINGLNQFWVRIENGCGSVDSATARVANAAARTGRAGVTRGGTGRP
ncbi:MAG TPA: choice-of-anchor L domain-containing protein [Thermoanaerobaculia bacterium]